MIIDDVKILRVSPFPSHLAEILRPTGDNDGSCPKLEYLSEDSYSDDEEGSLYGESVPLEDKAGLEINEPIRLLPRASTFMDFEADRGLW